MSEKPYKLTEEMRILNPVQDHSGNPADKMHKRDWGKQESYLLPPARAASGWKSKCMAGAKHLAIAFALAGGTLAVLNYDRKAESYNFVDKAMDAAGAFIGRHLNGPLNGPR